MSDKDTIFELEDGCKVEIDNEGNVHFTNCNSLSLGAKDIAMINRIKDIIIEED